MGNSTCEFSSAKPPVLIVLASGIRSTFFQTGLFFAILTYLGRGDDANFDDIGSWVLSSDRSNMISKGGREAPAMLRIKDENTLRMLDVEGHDIASPHDLRRTKNVEPLEPRLAMRGMYRYSADAVCLLNASLAANGPLHKRKIMRRWNRPMPKLDAPPAKSFWSIWKARLPLSPRPRDSTDFGGRAFYRCLAGRDMRRALCVGTIGKHPLEVDALGRQGRDRDSQQREPYFVLDNKTKRIAGFGLQPGSPAVINRTATGSHSGKWP